MPGLLPATQHGQLLSEEGEGGGRHRVGELLSMAHAVVVGEKGSARQGNGDPCCCGQRGDSNFQNKDQEQIQRENGGTGYLPIVTTALRSFLCIRGVGLGTHLYITHAGGVKAQAVSCRLLDTMQIRIFVTREEMVG